MDTKHYFRAAFLILGGLGLFLVVRAFLLPSSFGKYGFYRGDNVAEQMLRPVHFSAKSACTDCHSDIWEKHQAGSHAAVQCQNCHDALSVHFNAEKGEMVGPMPIQKNTKLCLRCHLDLPSRRADFPRINPEEHLKGNPQEHEPGVCLTCHSPHSPKIGG